MRARAPGKVVLSGAYAVLEGAPAIVAAVDRYVLADAAREASFVTPEQRAALGDERPAPWFDASALRAGQRKLGLGSSAAILVASLGALALVTEPQLTPKQLATRVFLPALRAHRAAQGGGSGIDVAASAYGGVLIARREGEGLRLSPARLPAGLRVLVLSAQQPASTPELIARVGDLGAQAPALYTQLMARQAQASERAARAVRLGDADSFLHALRQQGDALAALGEAAGAPIVTEEVAALMSQAARVGAAALPAGAGGGDVALWVSPRSVADPRLDGALSALDLGFAPEGVARVAE
jgi:phosphomevalonate kinase